MNILIDIGHPGHVHLFKNLIFELRKKHNILVTTKNQKSVINLLKKFNIEFINLGKKYNSIYGKALSQIYFDYLIYKIIKKNNINLALGTSISISHACLFSKCKSIILNEDDAKEVPFFSKLSYPFADYILTPDCLKFENHNSKHIVYSSYHELAYLHPENFKPKENILKKLNINKNEKYFIVRFNAFKAHHDSGIKGISNKKNLINILEKYGKIFITTEGKIDPYFKKYQIQISPEEMHNAIFYATMFIGDSQTMAAEAAIMGTPSIRCNSFVGKLAYLEEIEKNYGLTIGFQPKYQDLMFKKIISLLEDETIKKKWLRKKKHMLKEKINLNTWLLQFISNFEKNKNSF
jgi:uncharacterized protein